MDLTLTEIINKSDAIYLKVLNLNFDKINKYLSKLSYLYNYVNNVSIKVHNIYNICNNTIINKIKKNKKHDLLFLDKSDDVINRNLTNDISINVKCVDNIDEIPNTTIYWVKNINQFAVKINNTILRGNVGNIYTNANIKNTDDVNQTVICRHKNNCDKLKIDTQICKFYHDPLELLELVNTNKMTLKTFNLYKNLTRNFINTSWLYTEKQFNKKNTMLRHFGSKNTLKNEIDLIKIDDSYQKKTIIDNYNQQVIHDLLVIIGLKQCSLLR